MSTDNPTRSLTTTSNVTKQGTVTPAGTVNYNPNTGAKLTAGQSVTVNSGGNTYGSNPVISGKDTSNQVRNINTDITGLRNAYAADNAMLQQQQALLAQRRTSTINDIKTQSEIDANAQANSQAHDYASRATNLVTSGGGFLGATQSQQGVLQNLQATFDSEKTALMAKRDAAINAANAAYEDKDFALAKEMSNNAKQLQSEMYKRQTDYANQALQIAQNNRAQTQFDMGITDKKIAGYAAMDNATFAAVNPSEIAEADAAYYPGYTAAMRTATQETNDATRLKNIASIASDTPMGRTFTLGGKTYAGTKAASGASLNDAIGVNIATQLGAPNLANMSRKQIIESMSYSVAPQWYKDLVKSQDPSGWDKMKNDPAMINQFWNQYRTNPDFTAFKNTVDINKVESGITNPLNQVIKNAINNPSPATQTTNPTPVPSGAAPSLFDKYY